MRTISNLTKDTRPLLEEILIEAIHDTIEIDRKKTNTDGSSIEYENHTFYYRVVYLFMQRSILYYDSNEVETWSKKELLKETTLPHIGTLRESLEANLGSL